jgi:methionyl-tRNA formyltransferase
MNKGADLVVKTAKAISDGNYPQTPQKSKEELKTAPKIFKEDCKINWDQESNKVRDFIRGLSPYPGAWTLLNEKVLKIFDTKISKEAIPGEIGHSDSDNKTFLRIKTQDGSLEILDLQLEGKKRMHVGDFLRGYQF